MEIDRAAVRKIVLFEHTAHNDVTLVGVDAQGSAAERPCVLCGVVDNSGGYTAAAVITLCW